MNSSRSTSSTSSPNKITTPTFLSWVTGRSNPPLKTIAIISAVKMSSSHSCFPSGTSWTSRGTRCALRFTRATCMLIRWIWGWSRLTISPSTTSYMFTWPLSLVSSCSTRKWAISTLLSRWSSSPGGGRWRCGWMPTWPKITPTMIKTHPTIFRMHTLTPKTNTKIFMAHRPIWYAGLFYSLKRTLINTNRWVSPSISCSQSIYKTKTSLTNYHSSTHSNSYTVTMCKTICIVHGGWSRYLSCFRLTKITISLLIIR